MSQDEFDPPIKGEVIAVGTSVNIAMMDKLSAHLEQKMVEAIVDCHARGVHDAPSILKAKMEAFEKAKAEFEEGL
jgi:hypothetical protein